MNEELKPCPFCGSRAHRRTIEIDELDDKCKPTKRILKRRLIECRNPKCLIKPSTWLHVNTLDWIVAIKAWNNRAGETK